MRQLFAGIWIACAGAVGAQERVEIGDTILHVSGPEDAARAVLVVHDYFGISLTTKAAVVRLGGMGFRAMAVDLYGGASATRHDDAVALMEALTPEHAQAQIAVARAELGERQVAILGYSMGGLPALRAAVADPDDYAAAMLVYGGGYEAVPDEALASAPPLLVASGSADDWSFPASLELATRGQGLGASVEAYVYPGAGHAYTQPLFDNGKTYDKVATEATRAVIDGFLERHLEVE